MLGFYPPKNVGVLNLSSTWIPAGIIKLVELHQVWKECLDDWRPLLAWFAVNSPDADSMDLDWTVDGLWDGSHGLYLRHE